MNPIGVISYFCFILLLHHCNLLIRLAFRLSISDILAHKAAGNQPIRVNCNIKQTIPCKTFPLKKKDNQGSKMAISIIKIGVGLL